MSITSKPANEERTGGTPMFYPVDCDSGKSN